MTTIKIEDLIDPNLKKHIFISITNFPYNMFRNNVEWLEVLMDEIEKYNTYVRNMNVQISKKQTGNYDRDYDEKYNKKTNTKD